MVQNQHSNGKSSNGSTAPEQSSRDWAAMANAAAQRLADEERDQLAHELGVSPKALQRLGVGKLQKGKFCFPERDADGTIIGVATRAPDGKKGFLEGGNRGLIVPTKWDSGCGPVYVVEGPSDVAAGITMKVNVLGRPFANAGAKKLATLLTDVSSDRDIIVMGELDPKPDGGWPGRDGAERVAQELATQLGRPIRWGMPPDTAKDLREWLGQWRKQHDGSQAAQAWRQFEDAIDKHLNTVNPGPVARRPELISTTEFLTATYHHDWLVHRILVRGQPAIVGGAKKTLKTNSLVDLVISLATGSRFQFLGP